MFCTPPIIYYQPQLNTKIKIKNKNTSGGGGDLIYRLNYEKNDEGLIQWMVVVVVVLSADGSANGLNSSVRLTNHAGSLT